MKKLNYIEFLRFIAALAVVITHYIHFYNPFYTESNFLVYKNYLDFDSNLLPLYEFLKYFYRFGYLGVYFFWQISGIVLAYTYFNKKTLNFKNFIINRIARLYPLHIFTLFLVLLLQIISVKIIGEQQITSNNFYNGINNYKSFLMHFFFLSGWVNESIKMSFNFPVWSVSVEILIYFIFFLVLLKIKKNKIFFNTIIMLLFLLLDKMNYNFFFIECGKFFFSGVLIYLIYKKFKNNKKLFFLPIILLIFSIFGNIKYILFFSSISLFFLLIEDLFNSKYLEKFSILGNLTYSSYLLHIPIQILIMNLISLFSINNSVFINFKFFIFYIFLVFFLSFYSYKYFENPLRILIRKKFHKH